MRREVVCVVFLSHQIFINVMKVFIKYSATSLIEFFLVKEENFKLENTIFSIKIHSNTGEDKVMDNNSYEQYYITGITVSSKDISRYSFRFQKLKNSVFSFGIEIIPDKNVRRQITDCINNYLEINGNLEKELEDELIDYLFELEEKN